MKRIVKFVRYILCFFNRKKTYIQELPPSIKISKEDFDKMGIIIVPSKNSTYLK